LTAGSPSALLEVCCFHCPEQSMCSRHRDYFEHWDYPEHLGHQERLDRLERSESFERVSRFQGLHGRLHGSRARFSLERPESERFGGQRSVLRLVTLGYDLRFQCSLRVANWESRHCSSWSPCLRRSCSLVVLRFALLIWSRTHSGVCVWLEILTAFLTVS